MKLLLALILILCLSITVQAYQPRWTYPNPIEHHLRTTHGINVSGMSHEDMLRLHDSLHDSGDSSHTVHSPMYRSVHRTIPQRRFFFRRIR